ncbi:MAG: hypothetical protein JWO36_4346 [Myxococcales bacterium]|nr:hypothetical protein [Myxococcales bacterium]
MRYAWSAALVLCVACTACKKEQPAAGLAPAKDWNAAPPPGTPATGPHAGNSDPDPHAGVDMGGANPHAGVDMGGGGSDPHAGIAPSAPKSLEKLPDGTLALGPFALTAPADWKIKPISSSMRAADFELPAAAGQEAELVVFYFGEAGAGSVQDNLDRWVGQFTQPDGKASKDVAKVEKAKFAGQEATVVSVSGHFAGMAMGGGSAVEKQDQAMLATIIASPSGPYYFKLVGAKKTVDANAAKFRALLASLKLR